MSFRLNYIRSLVVTAALVFAATISAQVNSATLLGTVKDASGAAVPGVTVTVKNVATAQERTSITDGAGNYTAANLQIGRYQVTVAAPGFKTATLSGIELQVGQLASANLVLEVGQVSENINVSAELPMMNTVSSTVSQVVDTKAVEEMPLNGRSFWQLAQLTPGRPIARAAEYRCERRFHSRLRGEYQYQRPSSDLDRMGARRRQYHRSAAWRHHHPAEC